MNNTGEAELTALLSTTDEWTSNVLAPLLVKLNGTRPAKQKGSALLLRLFVIPMVLASAVLGVVAGIFRVTDPEVISPLSGNVFIISAIVLTVKGNRQARRRRMETIAREFAIPVEDVTALERHIVRDAKLLHDIEGSLRSVDGHQFSNDLNARVSEALVAALLKTEFFDLIKPSPALDEQLEKVRGIRKTIDGLAKAHMFNTLVTTGATVYKRAEEVLTNRREMIELFTRMGVRNLATGAAPARQPKPEPAVVRQTSPAVSARDLFEQGRHQFKSKDFAAAKASFTQVLTELPDHPNAHFFLGASLFQLGQTEEAIPHLQSAIRSNPDQGDFQNTLGMALGRLGQYREADRHIARAAFLGHPQAKEVLAGTGKDFCKTCGAPLSVGAACSACAARAAGSGAG